MNWQRLFQELLVLKEKINKTFQNRMVYPVKWFDLISTGDATEIAGCDQTS